MVLVLLVLLASASLAEASAHPFNAWIPSDGQFQAPAPLVVRVSSQDAPATAPEPLSRVTAIDAGETDTFVDVGLIGRDESEIRGRSILFITTAYPDGLPARVKTFDPATGRITLYEPVPAGVVKANDVYRFAIASATVPAARLSPLAALTPAVPGTDGDDVIQNTSAIVAEALVTVAPSLTPPVPIPGLPADWNAAIGINPEAVGIDTGTGADTITNSGSITATATAIVAPIPIPGSLEGLSKTDVSSTASARSSAVESGDGADTITNSGTIESTATAVAAGVGLTITAGEGPKEASTLKGDIKATSEAGGLSTGGGDDTVTNLAALDVSASATSATAAGSVVGVKGDAAVSATATAESAASGIDNGDGRDVLVNEGTIGVTADSRAVALDVAVGVREGSKGSVKATVQGGATAKATATGVATDGQASETTSHHELVNDGSTIGLRYEQIGTRASADDTVANQGSIAATATATTVAAGIGVAVEGQASASAASTAEANSTGIDLGGGRDVLVNAGQLDATATATATALNVAVGVATGDAEVKAAADGSATARANATGVAADSRDADTSRALMLLVNTDGLSLQARETTTHASGDDTVTNTGAIQAQATSTTATAGIGVSVGGAAAAKITSTAESGATGIDLGGGNDVLINTGAVLTGAISTAVALNVAVGVASDSSSPKSKDAASAADGSAGATSRAIGIATDGLNSEAARSVELALGADGLSIRYESSQSRASGHDEVTNTGAITATAHANAVALGAAVTVKGSASANSTATTQASATAVDLGAGHDTLTNAGTLTAIAQSSSEAVKAAVSTKGKATASDGLWKGGVTSGATAVGADAVGAGDAADLAEVVVDGSGVHARYETAKGNLDVGGPDVITNTGAIVADATATSIAANVAVTSEGTAAAVSHVEAQAASIGIRTGNGDDDIRNLGTATMTVDADALAISGKVAVSGKGTAVAADALWDGGTKAGANAVGIDADSGRTETTVLTADVGATGAEIVRTASTESASGADNIENEQAIQVGATATAPSLSVALEAKKGLAAVVSSVAADAAATAIRAGGGADVIANRGDLNVDATSTAVAANVAIAKDGVALATSSVWDGGTKATATALGLDADGGAANTTSTTTLTVNGTGAMIVHETVTQNQQGDDTIVNEGRVDAQATATAVSADVAITTKGLSAALSQSTAQAAAEAIRGGGGNDDITNRGLLVSHAIATAVAASVAVTTDKGGAIAANAVWDGGTTAEATAVGINADGGNGRSTSTTTISTSDGGSIDRQSTSEAARGDDTIVNDGQIDATATATAPQVSVAVAVKGVAAAISTSTAKSKAVAIDAGDGNDAIANTGALTADATAVAVAINGSVVDKGVSIAANDVWDGGVNADARARGIDGGSGLETLVNDGQIVARANATAPSASFAVAATGVPVAISTATATSTATAIDSGADADDITNRNAGLPGRSGKLTADADAVAVTANVAVTNQGLAVAADAVWDGGTTARTTATGIDSGAGADTVRNAADIEATSDAVAASAAVSVAVTGVAAASATSTARASGAAIDTGADADTVSNSGTLTTDANATAAAASVTFTNTGVAAATDAVWDGGTKGTAVARGITTAGGADVVTNDGAITSDADATTASAAVSVSVNGLAGAVATSTSVAESTAIDTGDGIDRISNVTTGAGRTGALTATADAIAVTATVAVTMNGVAVAADSVWEGGTTASSTAKGIDAGLGTDVVNNGSDVSATATATTVSAAVAVAVTGVAGAVSNATGQSTATAIDAGTDASADSITNTGALEATANTTAVSAAVAFTTAGLTVAGNAAWDGGTTASATGTGIAAGQGTDTIVNAGTVEAHSDARAASAALSVAVVGVAGSVSTATAHAQTAAIDAGDGDDVIQNTSSGGLTTTASATGTAVNVAITGIGATVAADAVWDNGTKADAASRGIAGGAGRDNVTNDAVIDAQADSTTLSTSISLTGIGVGAAASTSASTATATAIDGGNDADVLTNRADLKATSTASATGVAVTITGIGGGVAGDAFWSGGTAATANATGVGGGGGDDAIANEAATVTADATSHTYSVAISVTGAGLAGAAAGSTSTARATAIDGGAGVDEIVTDRALVSKAASTASGVSVSVAGLGGAVAGSFVDNRTKADALATGIAGGDAADGITATDLSSITLAASAEANDTAISVSGVGVSFADASALAIASGTGIDGGDGDDTLTNHGDITAAAAIGAVPAAIFAESKAHGTSVALAGVSSGSATATAEGNAIGIDGGIGADLVTNTGTIDLAPAATSLGRTINVAVGGTSIGDARGIARATAAGLAGGAGDDRVINAGEITLTPTVSGVGQTMNVTVGGSSIGDASALAVARAAGLDGGAGNDLLANSSRIAATLTSLATAVSTGSVVGGSTLAASNTISEAAVAGLDGGDNDDSITNSAGGEIDIDARAGTHSDSVATGVFGSTRADAVTTSIGTAIGLEGGAGTDSLTNSGVIDVLASSDAFSKSSTTQVFGSSATSAGTTAVATSIGLDGGDGADTLLNRAFVTSGAEATGQIESLSHVFLGSGKGTSNVKTVGSASGLAGGIGDDQVTNEGTVLVDSLATLVVTGGVKATFGGTDAIATAGADATAAGLRGDTGTNVIDNAGTITVGATTDAQVSNHARAGWLWGDSDTRSDVSTAATAFGLSVEGGNNRLTSSGQVTVDAKALGFALSYASGTGLTFERDGASIANVTVGATAAGISVGDGRNVVVNGNTMTVTAVSGTSKPLTLNIGRVCTPVTHMVCHDETDANGNTVSVCVEQPVDPPETVCREQTVQVDNIATHAFSNGNGVDGDGNAVATAGATADAYGVKAGEGGNTIFNAADGKLVVTAKPDARASVFSDGDFAGDADGTATATAAGRAFGVWSGNGGDTVQNDGEIAVLAAPFAQARTQVSGGDIICIWYIFGTWCAGGGDGIGSATASFTAEAVGIRTGAGDDTVINGGKMTVTAAPEASGFTASVVDADQIPTRMTNVASTAVGIQTGSGHDTIVNTAKGVIAAEARDVPLAYSCIGGACSTALEAVGIQSGDGDDLIVNDGTVSARVVASNGTTHTGVAIDAGAGNDVVALGSGSRTIGTVTLGAGDDALVWNDGASVTSPPDGAAGEDTFVLGGTRSATFQLSDLGKTSVGFERQGKQGSSTWTLLGDGRVDWTVDEGTLAVTGTITGTFETTGQPAGEIAIRPGATLRRDDGQAAVVLNSGVLTNDGTVEAVATSGGAVETLGGATLVNNGAIDSTGIGIRVAGNSNTVLNYGTTTGAASGVLISGDGNSVSSAGVIRSPGVGVDVAGRGNVLSNTGLIEGTGGAAVQIGGTENAFVNQGRVEGIGSMGVAMNGAGNSLVNTGIISGHLTGVSMAGDGTMLANGGTVNAGDRAIEMSGRSGTVLNEGAITSSGAGIVVTGEGYSVTNRGQVTAEAAAVLVLSGADSTGQIRNEESGVIRSTQSIAIRGGDGRELVENSGWLAGSGTALDLAGGNDVLRLGTTYRMDGLALGGDGFDTLVLAGVGHAQAAFGAFGGFESLQKEGASSWRVTGSANLAWLVAQGELLVDGALTGAGVVQSGGRLGGNGSVGSVVNSGIVAPGASIGTLRVLGDYEQTRDGALEIEGTSISDVSDRLIVEGRTVLGGGSLAAVSDAADRYGVATEYTILTAAGGVTGTFDSAVSNLANLDPHVDYRANSVSLMLIRNDIWFHDMGTTSNLQAFGAALDANKRAMARGEFKGLMDTIAFMDESEQKTALETLTGELHATTARALTHMGNRFFAATMDRQLGARQLVDGRHVFWADAVGMTGSIEGDGNASGATYRTTGLATGVDVMLSDATRIGAGIGFAPGRTELLRSNGGTATVHSYHPTIYGAHDAGRWEIGLGAGFSRHNVDAARTVAVGSFVRQAGADYAADQYSGFLRGAFDIPRVREASLKAFGELRYSRLTRGAFSENGAGSASLTEVPRARTDSLSLVLGVRASWAPDAWKNRVRPELKAGWSRESMDVNGNLTGSLTGALVRDGFEPFSIAGVTEARQGAVFGLGAAAGLSKNGDAFVSYDGRLSPSGSEHGFTAGARLSW